MCNRDRFLIRTLLINWKLEHLNSFFIFSWMLNALLWNISPYMLNALCGTPLHISSMHLSVTFLHMCSSSTHICGTHLYVCSMCLCGMLFYMCICMDHLCMYAQCTLWDSSPYVLNVSLWNAKTLRRKLFRE